jgi:hypothetical protein
LLPTFWSIGLRCCDHGGRVMNGYVTWAWGSRGIKQVYREGHAASDGPAAIYEIGLRTYLRLLREERKKYE